ncbi:hypothetical protein GGTG_08095 [Gaeumannomyces tritici R3-111a-1]|uniref:Uncharacterized protein n=1 Tax=Gaeumannomyces tritici (strain R3-111a-1) TaxID=644352 RepID=J3P3K9_GAET3|nr:hypothetical protein GGTG_08095 [Gaeumannomyces tritici R3-111a-1]EJT74252.1 hypothetical protein GGTG_08095 [Gaeumannomyces tritici R3-111a-1]
MYPGTRFEKAMPPNHSPSPSPPPSGARRQLAESNNRRPSPSRARSRSRGPPARQSSLSPSRSRASSRSSFRSRDRSRSRDRDRSRSRDRGTSGRSRSRLDDDRRRRRAGSRDSRASSFSSRSRSRSRSRSTRRFSGDDSAADRKPRKAKETAKEKEERKKSELKASAGFLGAVAVATFAAHKLWPKGYLYGSKEEWETRPVPKKVREEITEKRVEIRQEVDRLRGHRPAGNGELSPNSMSSTAATFGSIRAGGQDIDPLRRRPELLQRPAGNNGLSPTSISSNAATVGSSQIGGQEFDSLRRHPDFTQRDDNRVYYESTETRRYPASGYRPDRGGPLPPLRDPSDRGPTFEEREGRLLVAPPPRRDKVFYSTSPGRDRHDDARYAVPIGSEPRRAPSNRLVQKTSEEVQFVQQSSPARATVERTTSSSKVLLDDDPYAPRDMDRPSRYLDDAGRKYVDDRDYRGGGAVRETRRYEEYNSGEPCRDRDRVMDDKGQHGDVVRETRRYEEFTSGEPRRDRDWDRALEDKDHRGEVVRETRRYEEHTSSGEPRRDRERDRALDDKDYRGDVVRERRRYKEHSSGDETRRYEEYSSGGEPRHADEKGHRGAAVREVRRYEEHTSGEPRREQVRRESTRELQHRSSSPRNRVHWEREVEREDDRGSGVERHRERRSHQEQRPAAPAEYVSRELVVRSRHSPDPPRREAGEGARGGGGGYRDKEREALAYQRAGRNAYLGNADTVSPGADQ